MKIKKSELYFYELLRDFLHKYLIIQRKGEKGDFLQASMEAKNAFNSSSVKIWASYRICFLGIPPGMIYADFPVPTRYLAN